MFKLLVYITIFSTCSLPALSLKEPIVTAEKYIEYKKKNGHLKEFSPPEVILVCYQQSTLKNLLEHHPNIKLSDAFDNLYLLENSSVGILGGWGVGAPALAFKMECLIALGTRKFVAIGTAGSLMRKHQIGEFIIASKALAEDGVAQHYLEEERFAVVNEQLLSHWEEFSKQHTLPHFHLTGAWSFSAMFKETPADLLRVTKQGCDVVEMEAATLYAIGKQKSVQTLSLFVISDSITQDSWSPHIKEPKVRNNLNALADWALKFCKERAP
jgi:uridine phosphorylase